MKPSVIPIISFNLVGARHTFRRTASPKQICSVRTTANGHNAFFIIKQCVHYKLGFALPEFLVLRSIQSALFTIREVVKLLNSYRLSSLICETDSANLQYSR